VAIDAYDVGGMVLEDDELRVLRLLYRPTTKGELFEVTGLDDERLRTILQMLKRNDLAQLIEGKRWARTDLGTKRLEEAEEEPKEKPEPPRKESLTKRFEINRKRRDLIKLCDEIDSTLNKDWGWENELMKEVKSMKEDTDFIGQSLNEARNMEELEELEGLLEKVDKSWDDLFIENSDLFDKNRKFEMEEKLGRIREFYTEFYPELSQEEIEKMIKRCEEDSEQLKIACKHMESENNLESLLEHAFEHEIDTRFIRNVHYLADTEKLELEYVVQLWEDYGLLSSRYGPQEAYYFIKDRGRTFLKRRGSLWEAFHRYMFPQRMPAPAY